MPYYQRKKAISRNSRRYNRRRSYRSRRTPYQRRPNSKMTMYKNVAVKAPFAPTMYTKMTYVEGPLLLESGTTGAPYGLSFAMNGLYDPLLAVGGSQPQYFDSLLGAQNSVAPYANYVVTGAKITATFTTHTTTTSGEYPGLAIWANAGTGVFDTAHPFKDVMEMPWSRTAFTTANNFGANPARKLKMYVPIHTFFGVSKDTLLADNQYHGAFNANPTRPAVVHAAVYNTEDHNSGVNSVNLFIKIEYYVKLFTLWGTNARN